MLISGCDLQVGQFDQDLFSDTDAKNVSLKLILPKVGDASVLLFMLTIM